METQLLCHYRHLVRRSVGRCHLGTDEKSIEMYFKSDRKRKSVKITIKLKIKTIC
jgi:hypothetical protein